MRSRQPGDGLETVRPQETGGLNLRALRQVGKCLGEILICLVRQPDLWRPFLKPAKANIKVLKGLGEEEGPAWLCEPLPRKAQCTSAGQPPALSPVSAPASTVVVL